MRGLVLAAVVGGLMLSAVSPFSPVRPVQASEEDLEWHCAPGVVNATVLDTRDGKLKDANCVTRTLTPIVIESNADSDASANAYCVRAGGAPHAGFCVWTTTFEPNGVRAHAFVRAVWIGTLDWWVCESGWDGAKCPDPLVSISDYPTGGPGQPTVRVDGASGSSLGVGGVQIHPCITHALVLNDAAVASEDWVCN